MMVDIVGSHDQTLTESLKLLELLSASYFVGF